MSTQSRRRCNPSRDRPVMERLIFSGQAAM